MGTLGSAVSLAIAGFAGLAGTADFAVYLGIVGFAG